jgi:arylsulfatase A-like enzyme
VNVIFISLDSLNRHFLAAYGGGGAHTPNIDRLAARALIFDNHYCGSMPCMPARREVFTGTNEMWWRCWGPLEVWDKPIAYLAGLKGIKTQLITDHYHFFEWGAHSYNYDFEGYIAIRGHEVDNWRTKDIARMTPDTVSTLKHRGEIWKAYARNVQDFEDEGDFFGPQTFQATCAWLDENASSPRPFYLHIDSFDPHEPFHVPEPYRSMYTDDPGPLSYWPPYGRAAELLSDRELAWLRAQYAGKVTMTDAWLGRLLDTIDRYELWRNTAVILTSDHGHYLGDHGWVGKPQAPLYDTITRIPLLMAVPGVAPRRISAVTQAVDLYATMLELLGCEPPTTETVHSRSLLPLIRGEKSDHRDCAIYGYFGESVGITMDGWTLARSHDPTLAPIYQYTNELQVFNRSAWTRLNPKRRFGHPDMTPAQIPGVDIPVWRALDERYNKRKLWDDHLFHTAEDPGQTTNLAADTPDMVTALAARLKDYLEEIGAPREVLIRLRLV